MTKEKMQRGLERSWNMSHDERQPSENYTSGFNAGVAWVLREMMKLKLDELCEGVVNLYKELDLYQQDRIVDGK